MTTELKSYLQLHFVVLIWGFTAILGLLIAIPAVEIVFYRTLLATLILLILLLLWKKNLSIGRKETFKILGTGVIIAAHWILFFGAARASTASVCLAGMATCSFWTSLIEPMMTNRKVKIYEVILGTMVIIGLYVIFKFEFQYALGLSMAIISAILASVFTVLNGQFTHRQTPYVITFYEMLGAFLATAIFLPFYIIYISPDNFNLIPTQLDWLYLVLLAGICTVFAFSVSVKIQQILSAFVVNLTVNLEPVYGIVLAFVIFGEKEEMTPGFYWGTLIILFSVLLYPLVNKIVKRRALQSDMLR